MWGVCLRHPLLFYVGSFFFIWGDLYLPHVVVLYGEFLLHAPCCFIWGDSCTRPMLFYMVTFVYMAHAVLCGEFLLHIPSCFRWEVSLTLLVCVFYAGSLFPMPYAICYQEYL